MTLQPVQFGALTPRQIRMIERDIPGWATPNAFSGRCLPGSEIMDYMEQEGQRILGENPLSEDTFTASDDFMAAEADLASAYELVGGDDPSPRDIIHRSQPTAALTQQAARRILALIGQSDAFYVGDRLVQTLVRALQN